MSNRLGHKGEEIAYLTLMRQKVKEPCLLTSWCMKREFFRHYARTRNIYEDKVLTAVNAYLNAGANLCPELMMPSPAIEHLYIDVFTGTGVEYHPAAAGKSATPEDVRDYIAALPEPDSLQTDFDVALQARNYARRILDLRETAGGKMLFLGDFGQTDFMGGYTKWGYEAYLTAIALYPEYLKRYYEYTGEEARLYNLAVAEAVKKYRLAPFVYGGQDLCYNSGPLVSVKTLAELYLPALEKAVQPLHDAKINIIWHCDGDVRLIADILLNRIGVQGFQGFEEKTGCTLEHMASLKTRAGERPILWGSVSVTATLPYGAVADVKAEVERCFNTAGKTGFVLASSSSILPEAPLENIAALYEHGIKYGRDFLGG